MSNDGTRIRTGKILRTWLPLEAAWLLMAAEGPFIAAIVARLAEPTLNLAAFGIAFTLGLLFESPIILIMSAAAALVKDRESLQRLFRFTFSLNAAITCAHLICVMPPVFHWLANDLMGLPAAIVSKAYIALILLLPWPGQSSRQRCSGAP